MYNEKIICPEKSKLIETILKEELGYDQNKRGSLWERYFSHYDGTGWELRIPNNILGFGCKLRIVDDIFLDDIEPCPVFIDYYPEQQSAERDRVCHRVNRRIFQEVYGLTPKGTERWLVSEENDEVTSK